jgi:hypothetical protein
VDAEALDAIIAEVRTGRPVRQAIKECSVSAWSFYNALDGDPDAAERYARAREAGMDALADATLAIADDPDVPSDQKRIMVDARKWILSKQAPKRYGDKVDLTHAGPDGGAIITRVENVIIDPKNAG